MDAIQQAYDEVAHSKIRQEFNILSQEGQGQQGLMLSRAGLAAFYSVAIFSAQRNLQEGKRSRRSP